MRHAAAALGLDRGARAGGHGASPPTADAPPDLRGAAFGFGWSLGAHAAGRRSRGPCAGASGAGTLGDWLAGLFALAREEVLRRDERRRSAVLDDLVAAMADDDFLVALPALRQAFGYFPPRERETIAAQLLALHGGDGLGAVAAACRTPTRLLVAAGTGAGRAGSTRC